MVRIAKDPEERKAELMDAALELFSTHGFEETAVSDIVKKVGVAQGTFYYYFESKEHVLNEIMDRMIDWMVQEISVLCEQKDMTAVEKLNRIFFLFMDMGDGSGTLGQYMHSEKNELLHRKLMNKSITRIKPMIVEILRSGITSGEFNTIYPEEATDLMIYGVSEFFHRNILHNQSGRRGHYLRVLEDYLERLLGAHKWRIKLIPREATKHGTDDPL